MHYAKNPRVAVVGGGIGGLATAGFLHRAGLDVTVYEQAAMATEVGAGLVVSPNAARLLRRLGVMQEFQRLAAPLEVGWEFRRWQDGRVLFSQRLGADCERLYGEHTYTAHRADLLACWLRRFRSRAYAWARAASPSGVGRITWPSRSPTGRRPRPTS